MPLATATKAPTQRPTRPGRTFARVKLDVGWGLAGAQWLCPWCGCEGVFKMAIKRMESARGRRTQRREMGAGRGAQGSLPSLQTRGRPGQGRQAQPGATPEGGGPVQRSQEPGWVWARRASMLASEDTDVFGAGVEVGWS